MIIGYKIYPHLTYIRIIDHAGKKSTGMFEPMEFKCFRCIVRFRRKPDIDVIILHFKFSHFGQTVRHGVGIEPGAETASQ